MPFLNVKVSGDGSPEQSRQIAAALLDLTTRVLKKSSAVTSIAIDTVDPQHWIIAGRTLAEQGKSSFWLDIKVTDGTNSKDEKAEYVRLVFQTMAELIGPLHEESYVFVHDVRAEAYGYGGLTQEFRYVASKLQAA
jgi:4-oxalocrotonate tautomerase